MHRVLMKAAALAGAAMVSASQAAVVWSGSSQDRAASVSFSVIDTDLEITLTNTSNADAMVPVDVLTAVLFDISGESPTLTPLSAILASGSTVLFGSAEPGGGVGGEWAYADDPLSGYSYGISSSGLGSFGPHDRFPGINLQGPESPGGLEYGLTSAGDNPLTGNTPMTGGNALIKNSVVFRLGGLPAGFDTARIRSVRFQYGTDFSEPSFPGVPAPGSLVVLGAASLVMGRRRRL